MVTHILLPPVFATSPLLPARPEGGQPARQVWPRGSRTRPPGRAAGPPRRRCRSSRCAAPPSRIGVQVRRLPSSAAAVSASQVAGPRVAVRPWLLRWRRALAIQSVARVATVSLCQSFQHSGQVKRRRASELLLLSTLSAANLRRRGEAPGSLRPVYFDSCGCVCDAACVPGASYEPRLQRKSVCAPC